MLTPILVFVSLIGAAFLAVGILEQRRRLNDFSPAPKRTARPLLLVFAFPTQNVDVNTQRRTVEAILPTYRNQIEILFVSVFDQLEYAAQFGSYTVPATLLLDARGEVAFVNPSFATAAQLQSQISEILSPSPSSPPFAVAAPTYRPRPDTFTFKELPCQS